jgi:hypothetical protein
MPLADRRIDIYVDEKTQWVVDVAGFGESQAGWRAHLTLLGRAAGVPPKEHPEGVSGVPSIFDSPAGRWRYTNRVSVVENEGGVLVVLSTWDAIVTTALLRDVFVAASNGINGFATLDSTGTSHFHKPVGDA